MLTHSKEKFDLGWMNGQEWHLNHPKKEESQKISGADAGTLRQVIGHMPP
jgi:hypothetical protein